MEFGFELTFSLRICSLGVVVAGTDSEGNAIYRLMFQASELGEATTSQQTEELKDVDG